VKLDWISARLAFNERDTEKLLRMIENQFGVQISRQMNFKFIPHEWEEIVVCIGSTLTSYKIDKSGWTTWSWRFTSIVNNGLYHDTVIIYGLNR